MEMTAVDREGRLTVTLSGEIDHHSAKDIREAIDRLLVEAHPKALVLDLSGIDFMDSSGLGLVLGRYRRAKETGTEMYLANTSDRVGKILKMAGVDKLIRTLRKDAENKSKGENRQ